MTRILDYTGRDADRTVTVAGIAALKDSRKQLAQVTAATAAEAAAAETAGIEMVVCMASAVPAVRQGSQRVFVTAAIDFGGAVTLDELLGTALQALTDGADAVITARRLDAVRLLAEEDIPVMGHLGFVPKTSTLYGGVRMVGKTADEAARLWKKFQQLEEAGAVLVAKLTSGELASGDTWFGGQTKNPWNPEEGSGGSSAGTRASTRSHPCRALRHLAHGRVRCSWAGCDGIPRPCAGE